MHLICSVIQSFTGQLSRHIFEDLRRKEAAALKIQRALRIYLERRSYIEAVVTVQSGLRGMAARDVLGRKIKATLAIQVAKSLFLFIFELFSSLQISLKIPSLIFIAYTRFIAVDTWPSRTTRS